jgi:hypothetical protein
LFIWKGINKFFSTKNGYYHYIQLWLFSLEVYDILSLEVINKNKDKSSPFFKGVKDFY